MKKITQHLTADLKNALKSADEIWVAVALMTYQGLKSIQESLPIKCQQNFILGTDLPTEPKVLEYLYENGFKALVNASIYIDKPFYHPKVYIVKSKSNYIAFVGSANCTKNGLEANIEMSVIITDENECKELINWFKNLEGQTKKLTQTFIDDYKKDYKARKDQNKEDEKLAKEIKNRLRKEAEATMKSRAELIKILKADRKSSGYIQVKKDRKAVLNDIRKSLDYPDFNKIDLESFFQIHELGHILSIPKPTLLREIKKFKQMLELLANENIDVAERVDKTIKGNLAIRGVKEALISKVLTIHKPDLYYVKNGKSESALKKFGIELPRKLSKGEQYKATCKFLIEICTETGIDDLSILDHYLYLLANEQN